MLRIVKKLDENYTFGISETCPFIGKAVIFSPAGAIENCHHNIPDLATHAASQFEAMGLLTHVYHDLNSYEIDEIVDQIALENHMDLFVCVIFSHHRDNKSYEFHGFDGVPVDLNNNICNKLEASENLKGTVKLFMTDFGLKSNVLSKKSKLSLKNHDAIPNSPSNPTSEGETSDDDDDDGFGDNLSAPVNVDLSNTYKISFIGSEHKKFDSSYAFNEFISHLQHEESSAHLMNNINTVNSALITKTHGLCVHPPVVVVENFDTTASLAITEHTNSDITAWLESAVQIVGTGIYEPEDSTLLNTTPANSLQSHIPYLVYRWFALGIIDFNSLADNRLELIDSLPFMNHPETKDHCLPANYSEILTKILNGHVLVPTAFGVRFVLKVHETSEFSPAKMEEILVNVWRTLLDLQFSGSFENTLNWVYIYESLTSVLTCHSVLRTVAKGPQSVQNVVSILQYITNSKVVVQFVTHFKSTEQYIDVMKRFDKVKKTSTMFEKKSSLICNNCLGVLTIPDTAIQGDFYHGERKIFDGKYLKHGRGTIRHRDGSVYDGNWVKDKKHGFGYAHRMGFGYYIGEWRDDMKNGRGRFYYYSGDCSDCEWRNNNMHGQGTFVKNNGTVVTGSFKGIEIRAGDIASGFFIGMELNGSGSFTFANGDSYVGEFVNNEMHGQGKRIINQPNGSKITLEGTFVHNKLNGFGVRTDPNFGTYTGNFVENVCSGSGELISPDGSVYTGNFEADAPHGHGVSRKSSGIFDGHWERGVAHGHMRIEFANNAGVFVGNMHYSSFNGFGVITKPNGDVYRGCFKNNVFNGQGTYTSSTFEIDGHWEQGQLNGFGTHKSETDVYKGYWRQGAKHGYGTLTVFATNTVTAGEWKSGVLSFGVQTYTNGDKYCGSFKADKYHGFGVYNIMNTSGIVGTGGDVYAGFWVNGHFKGSRGGKLTARLDQWKYLL